METPLIDSPILFSNTIIAGILATLLFVLYLSHKSKGGETKITAPKAPGSWPVLGHLHLLGAPHIPHVELAAIAEKIGPIFSIKLGIHPTLVVSSRELAKEIFTTNDIAVSNRPKTFAMKTMCYDTAMFGFAPYGAFWRDMRKMVTLELLSHRRLELLKDVRVSEVEDTVKDLYKNWLERSDKSSPGVMVEFKKLFSDLTLNVILRKIAGKKFFGPKAVGNMEEARKCQEAIRECFKYIGTFLMKDAVPSLGWLDVGGHEKAIKKTANVLDSVLGHWLEEHKQKMKSGETKEEQDFIDVMLSLMNGRSVAGHDADTVIKATCLSLIGAGTDTTLVTLTWAVSLLLNNKHALKRAKDELDAVVGKERLVEESDINKLTYLHAIVKETMRLYPAGSLLTRIFSEDCTIDGYKVPKNAWVLVNIWKIQRDPQTYPDPHDFKPERFFTTNKDIDSRGQHFELLPFGCGRRICPGISLGLQTVYLTLAGLLHAFDISAPNDKPIDMTGSPGLTNLKATPLEVLISPRLSHELYA